jgi:hypothetical protein|tara:strand:+ start:13066 stop:13218 length:153 start_codon:yes stop_codon:yes gene_type:complete
MALKASVKDIEGDALSTRVDLARVAVRRSMASRSAHLVRLRDEPRRAFET